MRLLSVTTLAACLVAAPIGAQALRPVTPARFGQWESLGAGTLSPDGHWLAYVINRVNERGELRIGGTDTTIVVPLGTVPQFGADSKWLAYAIGVDPTVRERLSRQKKPVRNAMGARNLATGDTLLVPEVASFALSADGRFLAARGYPAEGRHTAPLVIVDLDRRTRVTVADVGEYAWADRGALLAFTVETERGDGNTIQLFNGATGATTVLESSSSIYREIAWRPRSASLAVLRTIVDTAAFRDTTHAIVAWSGVGTSRMAARTLDPATAPGFPAGMRISEHRTPSWSDDGETIWFGTRAREAAGRGAGARDSAVTNDFAGRDGRGAAAGNGATPGDSSQPAADRVSDVQIWHARDVRIMPMQKSQEDRDRRRTLLAAWHMRDNRIVPIGTDLFETTTVLEGDRWATQTDRSKYAFGEMFGRPYEDIWLIDTRTGERRLALEKVRYFSGGSATGERLYWFDGTDWWSQRVDGDAPINLTANVDASFTDPDDDYPGETVPPAGAAGWTTDDGALLVYDAFDVWRLAPDGSGGRRLTSGAADRVVHRVVRLEDEDEQPAIDLSRPVYLSLRGKDSKQTGWARLAPNGRVESLVLDDARLNRLQRADSAGVYAYTRERFDDSPDWFVGGPSLGDAHQRSATNPFQRDFAWGHSEIVDFNLPDGAMRQAALYYPAGYDSSKTYPMIVYTYELLSQNVHNYVVPSERSYYNFSAFTANGYFVLTPDIVFRDREPGPSVLESVESAVRTVVARGHVDPARIGIVGHSWGGYEATYLPTRTNIFAASVAGAPITNFLSFAGAIHWTPGIAEFDHWETGQARMEVPPWEDVDAYLRSSPIARVQDLKTPMLMEVGDADGTVDWHQGIEFYNFARRAGNTDFVLLVYPGEDHGLRKKENQIDYHRRILQWFGHWLKGEPAPSWITSGVSWTERKALLDAQK